MKDEHSKCESKKKKKIRHPFWELTYGQAVYCAARSPGLQKVKLKTKAQFQSMYKKCVQN